MGPGTSSANGGGMHSSDTEKSFFVRLQLRLAQARFFTFSALIHTVLIVIGGGVVLFREPSEPPDFTSGPNSLVTDAAVPEPPTTPVAPPSDAPQFDAPARVVSTDTITSLGPSTFAVPIAVGSTKGLGAKPLAGLAGLTASKFPQGLIGGNPSSFGTKEPTANGFTGTFYDLKQTAAGKPTNVSPDEFHTIYRKFVREHWSAKVLAAYFRAPQKLYTPQIFIPNMPADEGPKAFDLADKVKPSRWLVHYKARVSPPADGTYHFVGGGDDVMVVRFNGKVVLDRCWHQQDEAWKAARNYDYGYTGIPNGFARGDAMRLKSGDFYDMEVLIGEQPGGLVFFSLLIEEEGAEYRRDAKGNPILPVFRLAGGPLPELEKGQTFPPFDPVGQTWSAAPVRPGSGSGFDEFFTSK